MKLINSNSDRQIKINIETDFQANAGWEDNLSEFENEILKDIINPIVNYDTSRYIHEPYNSSGITQTDIWFYFYFKNGTGYTNGLDYSLVGITSEENEKMLKQSTKSFFRLEFFKTPGVISGTTLVCEPPTRRNRRLVFAKNLSLPLGEKFYYSVLNGYVHVPVFMGSNYRNKENMYLFCFQDESVLNETNLSGTTTGNTFFMTAKFYNAKDGSIIDFTNRQLSTEIVEENDLYYQVNLNKINDTYKMFQYTGTTGTRYGEINQPLRFYEKN